MLHSSSPQGVQRGAAAEHVVHMGEGVGIVHGGSFESCVSRHEHGREKYGVCNGGEDAHEPGSLRKGSSLFQMALDIHRAHPNEPQRRTVKYTVIVGDNSNWYADTEDEQK